MKRFIIVSALFLVCSFPAYAKKSYTNRPIVNPAVAEQHKKLFAPRLIEASIGIEYWKRIEKLGIPRSRTYKWGR